MDKVPPNARPAPCMHQQHKASPHHQVTQVSAHHMGGAIAAAPTGSQQQASHFAVQLATRPADIAPSLLEQRAPSLLEQRAPSLLEQRVPLLQFDGSLSETQMIGVQLNDIQTLGNIINEKVAIYRHPLFPLLRILFEKCEIATNSVETVNSLTFDHEIKSFITQMAKENKPFFTEDAEVDGLVCYVVYILLFVHFSIF